MAIETGIQYTDSTCNPTPGCLGCELYSLDPSRNHCWAATLIRRYAGRKGWPKSFTEPEYFPGRIEKAIRWADLTGTDRPDKSWLNGLPRIIFLNDLGDTFAPNAPNPETWLLPLIPAMAASPHVWLFFTKWPKRMYEFFTAHEPPANFWGLTSVTDQKTADARIPWLLKTPFAVRGVSAEPLLGAIDFDYESDICHCGDYVKNHGPGSDHGAVPMIDSYLHDGLNWLVVGGESGPGARPMHPNNVRQLQNQCQQAGIPFFLKQLGAWVQVEAHRDSGFSGGQYVTRIEQGLGFGGKIAWDGHTSSQLYRFDDGMLMWRVGKHEAGRLLDGREWTEMPEVPR
ncbi:MAG TPA: DUF5131 family protein [Planctomycetota bacterium]|nr:DUF5131 family protein [Planctomycetota bacterium]